MSFNRYYYDELSYLRDLGEVFARENPALAPFLTRQSTDPDVERLLEAFAFLTGRLREKLDDDLPELSHSLLSLIWPHYLRPVPSMTVVQFTPRMVGAAPSVVEPGVYLESRPIDGTRARFRTCYRTQVSPLRVAAVRLQSTPTAASLTLDLELMAGAAFATMTQDSLRFYLDTERDRLLGRTLYLYLNRFLDDVLVSSADGQELHLSAEALKPVGFGEDEAVIPQPKTGFSGYRLLQEYFLMPQKFMFVDLEGLQQIRQFTGSKLSIQFMFTRAFELNARVDASHFRLNATPAVNLFPFEGEPIKIHHTRTEYQVNPGGMRPDSFEIYAVDQVTGRRQGERKPVEYLPFDGYRHDMGDGESKPSYRLRRRANAPGQRSEISISFVRPRGDSAPLSETVSFQLTCSNAPLMDRLGAGMLDQPTETSPTQLTFSNLGPATAPVAPPLAGDLTWQLIANLSNNYASALDVTLMRRLLATYNFRAFYDRQAERQLNLMMSGLLGIDSQRLDWLLGGLPIRGHEIRVRMSEARFGGEAEMFLFAAVLERYLGRYANVNACYRLVAIGSDNNVEYAWPVRIGSRPAL
ncbi:MAG: type VI secretion system baseplate subunit TssF [Pseudomonadota bacterium]